MSSESIRHTAAGAAIGARVARPWTPGCSAQPRIAVSAHVPGAFVCPQDIRRHKGSLPNTRAPAP